jgi:hypothetical protein
MRQHPHRYRTMRASCCLCVQNLPAIAFSLDNHMARKLDDYALSAKLAT